MKTDLEKNGFNNGVWKSKEEYKEVCELPDIIGILPSILKSPIFVLDEKSAKKSNQLSVKWETGSFHFSRTGDNPFPTAKHAFWLLIIISKFAYRWNAKGEVKFTFAEILRLAGKNPHSTGAINSIVEGINRYINTHAKWENSFGPRKIAWGGSLIRKCDLWDEQGHLVRKNPGSSKNESNWHTLWLHEEIVEALKLGETRLYYSNIYKMKLKQSELLIYNYFHAFGDQKGFWHSLYNEDNGLIKAFSWGGRKDKFRPWLIKNIDSLKKKNLIESYKFNEDKTALFLKVTSVFDLPENKDAKQEMLSIDDSKNITPKNKAPKKKNYDLLKLPPEKVLEEYLMRKINGSIPSSLISVSETILEKYSGRRLPDSVIESLRNLLEQYPIH